MFQWLETDMEMFSEDDEDWRLVAKSTSVKIIAWAGIIFFLICALMAWRSGLGWGTLWFISFELLCLYLLTAGSVEMDSRHITYRTPFNTFRIRWDEIRRIEVDDKAGNIVFWGDDKRLNALGPGFWSGSDSRKMRKLLDRQIKKYGIAVKKTQKAMIRRSKNTKLSR